jgi:hypothetical protein
MAGRWEARQDRVLSGWALQAAEIQRTLSRWSYRSDKIETEIELEVKTAQELIELPPGEGAVEITSAPVITTPVVDYSQIKTGRGYNKSSKPQTRRRLKITDTKTGHKMTDRQILDAKVEILRLLSDGFCRTITEACEKLNLKPARVYDWAATDKDFKSLLEAIDEVTADRLESEFLHGGSFIPKMMILKGLRPKYRENYREVQSTEKMEQMLVELKKLGQKASA